MGSESRAWRGNAEYFDGQTSQARTAEVEIDPEGIHVHCEGVTRTVDRSTLRVENQFGRVRLEFGDAEEVIVLRDDGAFRALKANGLLRRHFEFTGAKWRKAALGIILLAGLLVAFFRLALDPLASLAVRLVPERTEEILGERVFDAFLNDFEVRDDPETRRILEKCEQALSPDGTEREPALDIVIVESPIKNAIAFPGGHIVVFRGLLDLMDDQDELFGVLAHEKGHVVLRHGLKRIARATMLGFITSAVLGDVSGLSAVVLDNSALLISLAYDRKEEATADAYAVQLLSVCRIDADGLEKLFAKLEAEEGAKVPEILTTHPATESRLADLQRSLTDQAGRAAGWEPLSEAEWRTLVQQ